MSSNNEDDDDDDYDDDDDDDDGDDCYVASAEEFNHAYLMTRWTRCVTASPAGKTATTRRS